MKAVLGMKAAPSLGTVPGPKVLRLKARVDRCTPLVPEALEFGALEFGALELAALEPPELGSGELGPGELESARADKPRPMSSAMRLS
ncbi:MAG TPA: hypothetical protein VG963_14120 [Polyangiaceae bacterium]|nr:hypothetical protein [Polyangiaceae bacterium]